MRSEKELEAEIADAIRVSNGERPDRPCAVTILARDQAEADWLRNRLRGKHHAKGVSVRLDGDPAVLAHARAS